MAELNDLGSLALKNPAHYVKGGVLTIKKRSGGNDTDFIL
jgi:hypothetical protein